MLWIEMKALVEEAMRDVGAGIVERALLNEALMMTALGAADDEGPEPVE